ncbi:DMT family transporter [Stella sp.]|uniref:DMT family transporter n=1 Tax=Stella sp. TaxID=2912054 RepID=UPI0035B30E68
MTAPDDTSGDRERRGRLVGAAFMVLAGLLFIALDTISKFLVAEYSVMQVTWGRYFFSMLPILALFAARGQFRYLRTGRPGLQILRSGLLFLASALFVLALRYLPLADTITLNHSSPLLVTALSVPLLAEKVGWRRWLAVIVGFIGVLVVVRPGFQELHWAVALPLVTATAMAFYNVTTRMLAATDHPMTTIFYTGLVGTVASLAAVPFVWAAPDLWGWIGLVTIGILGFVGHLAYIHAFSHAPPAFLAPLSYLGLAWGTLAGWALFGQLPDLGTFVGMGIIAGSGLYIIYRESIRRREHRGATG